MLLFGWFLLKTPTFEEAAARWADEVEKWNPGEEQGEDGDGNDES
jgi:hypothetical protein